MTEKAVELDPGADDQPELVDHPDEVAEEEAELGLAMYRAVDDLDDESDGLSRPVL